MASFFIFFPAKKVKAKEIDSFLKVAVFPIKKNNLKLDLLLDQALLDLNESFLHLGRFFPVEKKEIEEALTLVLQEKVNSIESVYEQAAKAMQVDLYLLISSFKDQGKIKAKIRIIPLSPEFLKFKKNITVTSNLFKNISLKMKKEIYSWHKNVPLKAKLLKKSKNNFILGAGEWHGLSPGEYSTFNNGQIKILKSSRYTSLIKFLLKKNLKQKNFLLIKNFPKTDHFINQIEKEIKINTLKKYELNHNLLKGTPAEKKFIESFCLINPGANACLPGYGSFLATGYLNLPQKSLDISSTIFSSGLILNHFLFLPLKTKFTTNFFPFIHENDKTEKENRLHYFLWGSLPLTLSVSFLDQLVYQFKKFNYLPPFFEDKDEAACLFSFFFPGGGLFYKGYRSLGWGYYSLEMTSAAYGFYHFNNGSKGRNAFVVLGIIKGLEMIQAYLISPSYEFYNIEINNLSFLLNLRNKENNPDGLNFIISKKF